MPITLLFFILIPLFEAAIGITVLLKNPKNPQNWSFAILLLSVAGWVATSGIAPYVPLQFVTITERLSFAFGALIASSLFIFSLSTFLTIKKFETILLLPLVPGLFTTVLSLTPALARDYTRIGKVITPSYGDGLPFYIGYFVTFMVLALLILALKFKKSEGVERKRIGFVLFGTTISAIIGTTFNLLIPYFFYDLRFDQPGGISSLFFTLFTAYAILKYRFLDVRVILKKSVTQTLLVALFIGLAAFFVGMLGNAVENSFDMSAWVSAGIIAVVLAAAYLPFQRTISRIVNYVFATALPRPAEIPKDILALKEEATAVVENVLHRKNVEIVLLAEMKAYGWKAEEIAALDEFIQIKKTALVFNAIAGIREHESEHAAMLNILERALFEREVAVAVPMLNRDTALIGCILLGTKKDDAFREDEIVYAKAFACGMGFRFGEMLKDATAGEQSEKTQITQA